jgi:hypothetical protein
MITTNTLTNNCKRSKESSQCIKENFKHSMDQNARQNGNPGYRNASPGTGDKNPVDRCQDNHKQNMCNDILINMVKTICRTIHAIYGHIMVYFSPFLSHTLHRIQKKFRSHVKSSCVKNYVKYIPFLFEIYAIIFHDFIVRIWVIMNFMCSLLHVYNDLCEPCGKGTIISIHRDNIKKLASIVIGLGLILITIFARTVGILSIPFLFYLINRTSKNIFNRGF